MFADHNRFGGSLTQSLAGPVAGFAEDIFKLTIGNIQQVAKGEDTKAASEMIKFAGKYTPGSSLWYARLALERGVIDQMQLWANIEGKTIKVTGGDRVIHHQADLQI